jgi:hypothetical protein
VSDYSHSWLPTGYITDLVEDPCIVILGNPDEEVVARFTRNVDPEEVRRAAEEGHKKSG